uniref:Uncharacterized protein n=1 Tax=Amphimedon queenslandica TaxID=400682 RepID=A0A1X7VSS8_AMPQE
MALGVPSGGAPVVPPGRTPAVPPAGAPVVPTAGAPVVPPTPALPLLHQQRQLIIAQLRAVNRHIYLNLPRRPGRGRGRGRRPRPQVGTKNYNFY